MRAAVYQAVRWRAGGASLAIWTHMAARVVIVTALVWAALTFGLVWYWTGYYGDVAAHRYFWLWILTWFFTEIIPLPFGSVPYRGGRYTIPSLYPFLCYKYNLGGSFSGVLALCTVGLSDHGDHLRCGRLGHVPAAARACR